MSLYEVELHKLYEGSWDWKLYCGGKYTGHSGNADTEKDAIEEGKKAKEYHSESQYRRVKL